jgi:hypothetical protein
MARHRIANLYVFFKSKVSKRRGLAVLADHNLKPISWFPQLNGHGLVLPPRLVESAYGLFETCPLVASVMLNTGG